MGYQEALQAAGAVVIDFQSFGDWQGRWYAKVNYKGALALIGGSFGSCSYCDSFQAEFDYQDRESPDYPERLAEFGRTYLDDPLDIGVEVKRLREASEWDMDSPEVLEWLESNFDVPDEPSSDIEETMRRLGERLGDNETIIYRQNWNKEKPWTLSTYHGYGYEENKDFATLEELAKQL